MRIFLPILALLAAAPALAAQDDYDLANALADRGWWDISEELFGRIATSAGLPPEQRAEGTYGMARLKIMRAEKEESADEKQKLYKSAIDDVQKFIKDFPTHRRRGEALSDLGFLYQSKGKYLMSLSKVDPTKLEEAEKTFAEAETLFTKLIEELKKTEKKRPGQDEEKANPSKFKADLAAFEDWEIKMMQAKYNYAVSLFAHAETYKDNTSKHAEMKRLLERMNKFLNDDFMWVYEWYLLAYDAFIYMGRAYQLLAETSEREKAEENWKQCFTYIGKAKGLLSKPEDRNNEDIRDIVTRAIYHEIKARLAYGDTKRGGQAAKVYAEAARLGEDLFRIVPNARFEEMGKAIRLEMARCYCKGGQVDKGIKLLQELAKQYKDTWVENVAIDILGEYGGEQSVGLAMEAANNLFERGPAYLYRAMQKFRKALGAIKKSEDEKYRAECWYRIGQCYYYLDRFYEAVVALSTLEKPPLGNSKDAPDAAILKLQSLARIAKMTKDRADEKALEDHRAFINRAFPNQATDQMVSQVAIDHEVKQDFLKAVAEWEKLAKPGKQLHEEATFRMGYNLYREGDRLMDMAIRERAAGDREKLMNQGIGYWQRALEALRRHLSIVDAMPSKEPKTIHRAVGATLFASKILVHHRVGKEEEALKISDGLDKKFPNADPRLSIGIMSLRLDAKVKKGLVQEAEEDLKALKAKYEKAGEGLDHYTRALAILANAFEEAATKEREKDPEKFELFSERAGEYYSAFFSLSTDVRRPDQTEAMAEKLFFVAEQQLRRGQAKNSKEDLTKSRENFAKALNLYKGYLADQETRLPKDQVRAINRKVTRCYLMTGQFNEAIKVYQEVTKDDATMRDGSSWEDLADCYMEQARATPKGGTRNDLLKQADKVYAQLAAMLMQQQVFNEHTWRLLYKHAEAIYELDLDAARYFFDQMEKKGYSPKWDADAEKGGSKWGFAPKFEELRKQVDAKVPPRK